MRKLVTIRQITELNPIEGADAIECATVDGWKVVVKKGEYVVGQHVLYIEIDSVLPDGVPEFEFLMARGTKDYHCEDNSIVNGHRLRTIKLRGQVSQGLVIPLPDTLSINIDSEGNSYVLNGLTEDRDLDDDFSDLFGVKKYDPIIPASLQGLVRGNYPGWMPKTDQERVQNCFKEVKDQGDTPWRIEEKVEGSSITIYNNDGEVGVTSRNLDLRMDQEGNTFVDVAKASGLVEWLETIGAGEKIAFRGELVGPGIQDNIYNLNKFRIYIYDVWLDGAYMNPIERDILLNSLLEQDCVDTDIVFKVPVVLDTAFTDFCTLEDILLNADGMSLINPNTLREGIVYKSLDEPVYSFKAISNKYLLKQKD